MLKSNTKIDSTKRKQNRKLLQKKLSKDSVTSTKFYDSSEERETGSNTSSNDSIDLFKKLKIRNLNNYNSGSFFCNDISPINADCKKINKINSPKLNSTNSLDQFNTSSYKVNSEEVNRSINYSDENIIYNNLNSNKVETNIDNKKNNDILNIEENNTKNSKVLNLYSDHQPISSYKIDNTDGLLGNDNNICYNFNNNSHHFIDNNSKDYTNNYSSYTVGNLSSYPNNNLDNYFDNGLNYYNNSNLNSYTNNNLNSYTSDNLSYPSHELNSLANKNNISQNLRNWSAHLNNFEYNNKRIDTINSPLDENYNLNIENQMDFLNMYSNRTPIGSNDPNMHYSPQHVNKNPYMVDNNYINNNTTVNTTTNNNTENTSISTANYTNINDNRIYDINANLNAPFMNIGKSPNGKVVEYSNYIDDKRNNLMNRPLKNNDVFNSNIIVEKEKVTNDVMVSENISSHTDYSRAKHSSHVIDKRIVHEGFDTIKIPKYREVEVVEKIVEVPVIHKVNKYVNKYEIKEVEKIVKKPINKYVETKIEVPELHFQDKIVEVPELHEIVKIVEKPEIKERIIYKNKIETKIIPKYIEVPVIKIVNKYEEYDDIGEVIKTVPVKKIVEVPNEIIKKVKVPIKKIIEKPNYVPIIKYNDVPVEKIVYTPKVQTVEFVKTIPKIIDVPVPVKVPKIKIIDKPYYVNKYVDRPVPVPVSKSIKPIYRYDHKKIIEIPIHKPYIVTHDTIVPKNVQNGMNVGRRSMYTKNIDLNSLNPSKVNELYNMVNKNNSNLQRSMSVDNNFIHKNSNNNDLFDNINVNGYGESSLGLSCNFSKLDNNHNQQFLNKKCLNPLIISKSLNNSINLKNPNFNSAKNNCYVNNTSKDAYMIYSNEPVNFRRKSDLFFNDSGLPGNYRSMSPLINNFNKPMQDSNSSYSKRGGVNFNGNQNGYNLSFPRNIHNSNGYINGVIHSNKSNYPLGSHNISGTNKFPNQFNNNINKIDDNFIDRHTSNDFSNTPYNDFGNSNNLNNIHSINNNSFMRSRSPSICSADGISAYVVEYVHGQNNSLNDSTYPKELNGNFTENMGSNYSFSGK